MSRQIAVAAQGLVKQYGEVEALSGVSFEVPTGTVLGLLGPNGAGKTTAVRILTTLTLPTAGVGEVLGVDVVTDPEQVRAVIGLAGQYAAVDENLTGRENMRLVGRLVHLSKGDIVRRTDELLERFDIADAGDRVVRTYSGGMRRRLDLAAALVHQPPVLFLDEPTTGLDPQGRSELWAVIETLVEGGTTVLLTTQYLEEADRLADRIVVIDHGTVIAEGTSTELKHMLGQTVIEVSFRDDDALTRAADELAPVGVVTRDGHVLRLNVDDGAAAMLATVRVLDAAKVEPVSMALHEPTLDDVFLSITGHRAQVDDDADGAARASGRRTRQGRARDNGGAGA